MPASGGGEPESAAGEEANLGVDRFDPTVREPVLDNCEHLVDAVAVLTETLIRTWRRAEDRGDESRAAGYRR